MTAPAPNTTTAIFLPAARFAGHVAASAVGFIALAIVALIPIYVVKLLIWAGGPVEFVEVFHWLEIAVLYVDIGLYGVTVLIWAVVFLAEEIRAARQVLVVRFSQIEWVGQLRNAQSAFT